MAFVFWIGGFVAVYRRSRELGRGWGASLLNGFVWPMGLGIGIARLFVPDDWMNE